MCCANRLLGFAPEDLLEEASVDTLLYVEISSEICCKMIDIWGLYSEWYNGRIFEKCNGLLGSMKPRQKFHSAFIYV
jgi:hypothetical protein